MGEWWGPTPLRATAKIRQIFTLDDWWNLSLSLGANPGCFFFFFPLSPSAPTYTVCGGFSFGTCKPVVMCTFHSDSDSFKQRLKNHPLLHGRCTNAHRVLCLACMGNFKGWRWFVSVWMWMCVSWHHWASDKSGEGKKRSMWRVDIKYPFLFFFLIKSFKYHSSKTRGIF